MNHIWQGISGWFNFGDVYRAAVERAQDGAVFVEVGTWLGQSAAFMAVEIINSGKAIAFHCVDHWQGSPETPEMGEALTAHDGYEIFKRNLAPVWDRLTVHRMSSVAAANSFAAASLDFCFIDAAHNYDAVMADIAAWLPKVKPGGILAGHDLDVGFLGVVHAVADSFGEDIDVVGNCWIHQVKEAAFVGR